jgi:hypothetical protein
MQNNPHQTQYGRTIDSVMLLITVAILFLLYTCTGCVSAKKYKALERDYQKIGNDLRNAEHGAKLYEIEVQDKERKAKRDSL